MRYLPIVAAAVILTAMPIYAEDLVLTLVNNSSANLVELYLSPHSADDWGDNILTVDMLKAGAKGNISVADGATTCDYDLRFVMDSGVTADGTQDLCKIGTFTLRD